MNQRVPVEGVRVYGSAHLFRPGIPGQEAQDPPGGAALAPDAWYDAASVKVGYEISFTRHFYKPEPLRALEEETEGLLAEIVGSRVLGI